MDYYDKNGNELKEGDEALVVLRLNHPYNPHIPMGSVVGKKLVKIVLNPRPQNGGHLCTFDDEFGYWSIVSHDIEKVKR